MRCQICGCTERQACVGEFEVDGGLVELACSWYVPGLCDFCVLEWTVPDVLQPLYPPPLAIAA